MSQDFPTADYFEGNRFKTISDFKWCMRQGGEVEFEWKNKLYYITHPDGIINIHREGHSFNAKECSSADEVLEYMVGEGRLRDVITKVTVWDRTI